jgi:flagellar protein FliO/FliZ
MTQSYITVGIFLALLACMPWLIKWLQKRTPASGAVPDSQSRLMSAVAVGPHQKVVTVEVGPEGSRHWLALGVTQQNVTLLHAGVMPARPEPASGKTAVTATKFHL